MKWFSGCGCQADEDELVWLANHKINGIDSIIACLRLLKNSLIPLSLTRAAVSGQVVNKIVD